MASQQEKKDLAVTLSDEAYLEYTKQLFSSIYWNSGWKGDYMLLAHGIPDEKLDWFRNKGILVHKVKPFPGKKIGIAHHPSTVLAKFYLFTPYFKSWRKVVFLDADTSVRASLDNLLSIDGFSAPNATSLRLKTEFNESADPKLYKQLIAEHSIKGSAFNTGVMAFDTGIIGLKTFDGIMELFERYGVLNSFGEEATLNLFFYKRWRRLPIMYNTYPHYMKRFYGLRKSQIRAVIMHFILPDRAWNRESEWYPEWRENYEKADKINLLIRPEPALILSHADIIYYRFWLWSTKGLYYWYRHGIRIVDNLIGKFGIFLKKISPSTYTWINNLVILPIKGIKMRKQTIAAKKFKE